MLREIIALYNAFIVPQRDFYFILPFVLIKLYMCMFMCWTEWFGINYYYELSHSDVVI